MLMNIMKLIDQICPLQTMEITQKDVNITEKEQKEFQKENVESEIDKRNEYQVSPIHEQQKNVYLIHTPYNRILSL